jgi:hypothetical protein
LADLYYTDQEWEQITGGGRPMANLHPNQGMLLHRHWLWADHARRWFENELPNRDATAASEVQLAEEWVCAMYVWYGLLWALIEGIRVRRIRLGPPMSTDIRRIAEPLRESRNASFHIGRHDTSWDLRFFAVMEDPSSAETILRVHKGFARLFFEEAQARGVESVSPEGEQDASDE